MAITSERWTFVISSCVTGCGRAEMHVVTPSGPRCLACIGQGRDAARPAEIDADQERAEKTIGGRLGALCVELVESPELADTQVWEDLVCTTDEAWIEGARRLAGVLKSWVEGGSR